MHASSTNFILGSRSPQRLELLSLIVPAERIEVVPPGDTAELGFDDVADWPSLEDRLIEIARAKSDDVVGQVIDKPEYRRGERSYVVIAADTTIVVERQDGRPLALGQPPEDESWSETVRDWFREFFLGRTHVAATALCVTLLVDPARKPRHIVQTVESKVSLYDDGERWLDWYLSTGEPRGKAGGYAIQGSGSLFVSGLQGSLSNVVGLPLRELLEILARLGINDI